MCGPRGITLSNLTRRPVFRVYDLVFFGVMVDSIESDAHVKKGHESQLTRLDDKIGHRAQQRDLCMVEASVCTQTGFSIKRLVSFKYETSHKLPDAITFSSCFEMNNKLETGRQFDSSSTLRLCFFNRGVMKAFFTVSWKSVEAMDLLNSVVMKGARSVQQSFTCYVVIGSSKQC